MTFTSPQPADATAATPTPFRSLGAVLRFRRRALTAIRHATHHGLFTQHEASTMVDRVHALTVATLASLTPGADDTRRAAGSPAVRPGQSVPAPDDRSAHRPPARLNPI